MEPRRFASFPTFYPSGSRRGSSVIGVVAIAAMAGVLGTAVYQNVTQAQQGSVRRANTITLQAFSSSLQRSLEDPFTCASALRNVAIPSPLSADRVKHGVKFNIPFLGSGAPIQAQNRYGGYLINDITLTTQFLPPPFQNGALRATRGTRVTDNVLETWSAEVTVNVTRPGALASNDIKFPLNMVVSSGVGIGIVSGCHGQSSPRELCEQMGGSYDASDVPDSEGASLLSDTRCKPYVWGKISSQGIVTDPALCHAPYEAAPVLGGNYLCQWANKYASTLEPPRGGGVPNAELKNIICGLDSVMNPAQKNQLISLYDPTLTDDQSNAIVTQLTNQLPTSAVQQMNDLNNMFTDDQKVFVQQLLISQRDGGGFQCSDSQWLSEISGLVVSGAPGNVTLSWVSGRGAADNLLSYQVGTDAPTRCASGDIGVVTPGRSENPVPVSTVLNLSSGQSYSFRVCAQNKTDSLISAGLTTTVYVPYPIPPSPVLPYRVSDTPNSLLIAWSSGGGSTTTYRVARTEGAMAPSSCSVANIDIATAAYTESGLTPNTQYNYLICAINGNPTPDLSTTGALISLRTPQPPPPLEISGLTAVPLSNPTRIKLSWSSGGGSTTGYYVVRATGLYPPSDCGSNRIVATNDVAATTTEDTNVTSDATYSYRVCAHNAGNPIEYSPGVGVTYQFSGTPGPGLPTPPDKSCRARICN